MNNTDTAIVDNWLAHLAARAGLDGLQLDERGRAALRYHEDLELLMELPEGSPVLQLYAPVLRLPAGAEQAALLRRLLALNLFALETRGAAFALDEHNERVLLQCQVLLAGTDAAQFERVFGNFAEAALHWRQALEPDGALSGHGEEAGDGHGADGPPATPVSPSVAPFMMRV